ncbi:MAG: sulfotransferase [Kiritimatiellae bacterium]|nr:sulfotransferase [Kiritimatiellia bacterium]
MLKRLKRQFAARNTDGHAGPAVGFVLSAPRSGSTWLKEALNAHPQVFCTENRLFGRYFDVLRAPGAARPRLRVTLDKYIDEFMLHYEWRRLPGGFEAARNHLFTRMVEAIVAASAELSGKPVLIDKVTPYPGTSTVVAASVTQVFPQAAVILLLRDGRDVLTSGVFHWLNKAREDEEEDEDDITRGRKARFVKREPGAALSRFFRDRDIEEWCAAWTDPLDAGRDLERKHRLLRVSYEKMVRDQTAELTRLFAFLQVDADPALVAGCVEASSFEKMSGGRQPGEADPTAHVRKGVVGDWQSHFTKRDGILFDKLAGRYLRELGYEPDRSWIERLPEELAL